MKFALQHYQLSIKLIGDENSFHVQPDVLCLGTQHVLSVEGCHAWNEQKAFELNLTLQYTYVQNSTFYLPIFKCLYHR